jgi:hypothetical protein
VGAIRGPGLGGDQGVATAATAPLGAVKRSTNICVWSPGGTSFNER